MRACGVVIRVVVADDSPEVRLLVRVVLEDDADFRVEAEAADGQEAVELAAALHPDLMLLDLSMPKMDGHQALPLILEASPETRVVVLSAFPADRETKEAPYELSPEYASLFDRVLDFAREQVTDATSGAITSSHPFGTPGMLKLTRIAVAATDRSCTGPRATP